MSDFRIIITGGRKRESEDDYGTMADVLDRLDTDGLMALHSVIIQGGCPTGADLLARKVADEFGIRVETFPADWQQHGRAAGPIRNQAMADAGADLCLAFPSRGRSAGTWDMVRRAVAAGIETRIYPEASHEHG